MRADATKGVPKAFAHGKPTSVTMLPSFTLQLNNPILRGLAAVGKYNGEHASLTCATAAGKIFFHSPHERDSKSDVTFLNIDIRGHILN